MLLSGLRVRSLERSQGEITFHGQRTREGIETARLNGKQIGQPKGAKLTTKKSIEAKEVIRKRSKDFNGDLSDLEVMKLTGIARGTYYKYKRELKEKYGNGVMVFHVESKSVPVGEPLTIFLENKPTPADKKSITITLKNDEEEKQS